MRVDQLKAGLNTPPQRGRRVEEVRKRIAVLVAAALLGVIYAVPAFALESGPNCVSGSANPESGFGNAEPGQAGDTNRTYAEANQKLFGAARSNSAQDTSGACGLAGEPGPPDSFDPKQNP